MELPEELQGKKKKAKSAADIAADKTAAELKQAASQEDAEDRQPEIDELGRSYATGRRKNSSARVWIKRGSGKIVVNGKAVEQYFARPVLRMVINQPFAITKTQNEFDIFCTVKGGGLSGQAGAVRHGLSRALDKYNPSLHTLLRQGGFLTRDSRAVERKKPGRKKARKRFQFSKR